MKKKKMQEKGKPPSSPQQANHVPAGSPPNEQIVRIPDIQQNQMVVHHASPSHQAFPEFSLNQRSEGTESNQNEQKNPLLTFFEKSTTLFVVLSIMGALIALLPSFLDVIIGKDWINLLLSTLLGFYVLTLLLITTYTSALFMFIILCIIVGIFNNEILTLENDKCSQEEKIVYSIVLIIGVIAIGSLILFLVLSWTTRIDYAIKNNILMAL